jgi:hypothetical protein
METIKLFLVAMIAIIAITASSCSKSEDSDNSNTCNDIVCGGSARPDGKYYIFRGTLNPDTCGETELIVNKATYDYYKSKWDLNPKGYACWEGLK